MLYEIDSFQYQKGGMHECIGHRHSTKSCVFARARGIDALPSDDFAEMMVDVPLQQAAVPTTLPAWLGEKQMGNKEDMFGYVRTVHVLGHTMWAKARLVKPADF